MCESISANGLAHEDIFYYNYRMLCMTQWIGNWTLSHRKVKQTLSGFSHLSLLYIN